MRLFLIAMLIGVSAFSAPVPYLSDYEVVAPSQTDQVLGPTGAAGDILDTLVVTVGTAATGTCSVTDGSTNISITEANTPIGVYSVKLGARSLSSGWKVTTGAGAKALGIGRFK